MGHCLSRANNNMDVHAHGYYPTPAQNVENVIHAAIATKPPPLPPIRIPPSKYDDEDEDPDTCETPYYDNWPPFKI